MSDIQEWIKHQRDQHKARAAQILSTAKAGDGIFYAWDENSFQLLDDDWDIRDHVLPVVTNSSCELGELSAVEAVIDAIPDMWDMGDGFDVYAVRYLCEVPRKYEVEKEVEVSYMARKAS